MSLFRSTSTHYLGTKLRNQLVPWDLHASMTDILVSDSGFTSLTSDWMIPRMFDFSSSIHIPWNVLEYRGSFLSFLDGRNGLGDEIYGQWDENELADF
jgi:hypothetical protein